MTTTRPSLPRPGRPTTGAARVLAALLLAPPVALSTGCPSSTDAGAAGASSPAPRPAPAGSEPAEVRAAGASAVAVPAMDPEADQRPRLVVSVVFDQLGSETLLEHLDLLDPEGAIRQAVERGAYFERSEYPQANTLTAPGHAVTYTGVPPRQNGVALNALWDRSEHRVVQTVADSRFPVFGRDPAVTAGPGRLLAPTVAASLKEHTGGAAHVVSVSLKDRAAIFPVGSSADAVLWFDAALGRFTSSGAWGPAVPTWAARYQQEHPLRELLTPWQPLTPALYAKRLGPDDASGEGTLPGGGRTFPHRFDAVSPPWTALRSSPRLSEYLIHLADAAVGAVALGQDSVPDLLLISISGTDYVGHAFGPRSWEYVDHLTRADRELGRWLARLERRMPIGVLVTSDHGVAPLPESQKGEAGRVHAQQLRSQVERQVAKTFGSGPWVDSLLSPYVYLSERARRHPKASELRRRVVEALEALPTIHAAFTADQLRRDVETSDPLRRAVLASLPPSSTVDVIFVTKKHYAMDIGRPDGAGTTHGSPYDYDRQVPVLAWGRGAPRLRRSEPVSQLQVAPTLARWLGVPPPGRAQEPPLF